MILALKVNVNVANSGEGFKGERGVRRKLGQLILQQELCQISGKSKLYFHFYLLLHYNSFIPTLPLHESSTGNCTLSTHIKFHTLLQ